MILKKVGFFSKILGMFFFRPYKDFLSKILGTVMWKQKSEWFENIFINFQNLVRPCLSVSQKLTLLLLNFCTLDGIFEIKMIKKICVGVIRFKIAGLQITFLKIFEKNNFFQNHCIEATVEELFTYRISSYSFRPWIVSSLE